MTSTGLSAAILSLSIMAPALKDPPAKEPPIVGTWQEIGRSNGLQYEFNSQGEWIISRAGQIHDPSTPRTFKLNPTDGPTAIDLTETPMPYLGIFKIEKDTLTLSFRHSGEGGRPTSVDFRGDGVMTLQFQRVKLKN